LVFLTGDGGAAHRLLEALPALAALLDLVGVLRADGVSEAGGDLLGAKDGRAAHGHLEAGALLALEARIGLHISFRTDGDRRALVLRRLGALNGGVAGRGFDAGGILRTIVDLFVAIGAGGISGAGGELIGSALNGHATNRDLFAGLTLRTLVNLEAPLGASGIGFTLTGLPGLGARSIVIDDNASAREREHGDHGCQEQEGALHREPHRRITS
jgi:hypothetical protein